MVTAPRVPLRALVVLGLLPNLLLAVSANVLHGIRPTVNIDFLVVAALDGLVSRALLGVLLTLALLMDVAFTFAPAFNFGPSEVVAAIAEIRHFSGRAVLMAIVVIAAIALLALLLVWLRGRPASDGRWGPAKVAAGAIGICLLADVANGSSIVAVRTRPVLGADLATSTVAIRFAAAPRDRPPSSGKLAAATDAVREAAMSSDAHALPTKIVLVIVETMGAPRGATARQMFAPLLSDAIERRFDTHTGLVPFFGATTSGELRELCGVAMNHFVAEIATLDCLPHRLRALGYESVAIHGYKASLMQRERWWPRVGFDRILFGDSLQRGRTLPECGALFHGVCDSSIVAVIREELTRQPARKQLVYWLTLSSHFPLTRRPPSSAPSCTALGSAGREREICALWDALWPTLTGLAGLAADTTIPRAWYILVGDHAPPWLMADTTLFDQRRVPLLELRPKR